MLLLLLLLLLLMITDGVYFLKCVLLFADSYGKYRFWHGVNREGEL